MRTRLPGLPVLALFLLAVPLATTAAAAPPCTVETVLPTTPTSRAVSRSRTQQPPRAIWPRRRRSAAAETRDAAAVAVRQYLGETALDEVTGFDRIRAASRSSGGLLGWVDVRAMAWYPSLDGHIQDSSDRLAVSELGLDDNEVAVMPQLHLSAGGIGVRVDAFFFEVEAQARVSREFSFGGVTFTVDDDVSSRLRIDNFRLLTMYPVVKTTPFTLWIQAGVSYFRFDAEVETNGVRGQDDGDLPIPIAGLLAQVKVWKLIVEIDISGFAIQYGSDLEGTALDIQISAGFVLAKVVAIRAGYRTVTIDGSFDSFEVDIRLDGFFLGGAINF